MPRADPQYKADARKPLRAAAQRTSPRWLLKVLLHRPDVMSQHLIVESLLPVNTTLLFGLNAMVATDELWPRNDRISWLVSTSNSRTV